MSRPTTGNATGDGIDTATSISKNAYTLAKSLDEALNPAEPETAAGKLSAEEQAAKIVKIKEENLRQKDLESEVMGTVKKGVTSQSDIKERNLSQMISVLHMRLANLEKRQAERMELVKEDVRTDSTKCSSDIKSRLDDMEDLGLTMTRGEGGGGYGKKGGAGGGHKENNLVSHAEGVQLDPLHLVLKTKQSTETAKRLEANLEEAFGTANTRDFRGQKKGGKNAAHGGSNRKTDQQKYDKKKQARMRLEKQLQTNMESFVTRSILDPELIFVAPNEVAHETVVWPITIKWPNRDPRSQQVGNYEGEMDPLLLLRYSIERMQLPAHEQLFRWLISQTAVQNYFTYLLWLIKVKFFQSEGGPKHEKYLLSEMSLYYAAIISLLSERTHAEHEKDHVYKYLPYLLCTAVYYGFHFLCPGSRHLYTKGFRKTILMQIVQIMNGVQLCPISVKVSWAKLFPDEAHEEEEADAEGGSESIPVQIALTQSKALTESLKKSATNDMSFGPTIESTMNPSGSTKGGKLAGEEEGAGNDAQKTYNAGTTAALGAATGGASYTSTNGTSGDRRGSNASAPDETFASALKKVVDPFERTFLTAPLERPGFYFEAKRQNVSLMNAQDISPLMQSLLGWDTTSGEKHQPIFRTVPVSWCPAGGSDTYKRRVISKDLHDTISAQVAKSEKEFAHESAMGHRRKLAAVKLVDKRCAVMMSSGQARISQYSLDLIKAQRTKEKGGKGGNTHADDELEGAVDTSMGNFDDGDFDQFLAVFD